MSGGIYLITSEGPANFVPKLHLRTSIPNLLLNDRADIYTIQPQPSGLKGEVNQDISLALHFLGFSRLLPNSR